MLSLKELIRSGLQAGFTHVVPLNCQTIKLLPEVRQMCEKNTCGKYNQNWCCPPGCGTLAECEEKLCGYSQGILVQTVGELEDSLDGEGMMEAERVHKEHFQLLEETLRKNCPDLDFLPIGAGCCTRCKTCTYPDAPCRFPDQSFASMEAYGMLVTQVCEDNHLPYYYGPNSIAYTSCFLMK